MMIRGVHPRRQFPSQAPQTRICVCRVARSRSSYGASDASSSGSPMPASVGTGQETASNTAAVQPKDTDLAVLPAPISAEPFMEESNGECRALKLRILNAVAGTDRGASATLVRHRQVAQLTEELSAMNPTPDAFLGPQAAMSGSWELVYTTAETFRSSPFFWAFAEGLIRDRDMASAIFAFTDSIPGAYIGRAVQDIDVETGSLVSRVNMTVFPAISGTVVTTSTITGFGSDFEVAVQDTRVDNSVFSPLLDNVVVPVRQIFEQLRGSGATIVGATVMYLDEDFRIVRTVDDQVFMYTRLM